MLAKYRGQRPPKPDLTGDSVAFLTYTSGTTGPPKGAMTTHRNVVFNAQTYRDWVGVDADDVILGVAPLFHITGLIAHIALAELTGAPLVLMYRMDPADTIATIAREKATFTVGSITVFIALMNVPDATRRRSRACRRSTPAGRRSRRARSPSSSSGSGTTSTTCTA